MADRLYSFIYEAGKIPKNELALYLNGVQSFIDKLDHMSLKELEVEYPAFKLGVEAQEAKNKAENQKTIKKPKKTTKEKK
jgi:hypothetical protein